jgi:hypothetical protein
MQDHPSYGTSPPPPQIALPAETFCRAAEFRELEEKVSVRTLRCRAFKRVKSGSGMRKNTSAGLGRVFIGFQFSMHRARGAHFASPLSFSSPCTSLPKKQRSRVFQHRFKGLFSFSALENDSITIRDIAP